MSDHESSAYLRVNGQMLHSMQGRKVCLLGKLEKEMPDRMSFELTTMDNKSVMVRLKVDIREALTDYVEVYGIVDDSGDINCLNYTTIDPSLSANFDAENYNETIQMIHQLPQLYPQLIA